MIKLLQCLYFRRYIIIVIAYLWCAPDAAILVQRTAMAQYRYA